MEAAERYRPVSASRSPFVGSVNQAGESRPTSRLGIQRGAITSKFVVPRLNLEDLQQRPKSGNGAVQQTSHQQSVNKAEVARLDRSAQSSFEAPQLPASTESKRGQDTGNQIRSLPTGIPMDSEDRIAPLASVRIGLPSANDNLPKPSPRLGRPLSPLLNTSLAVKQISTPNTHVSTSPLLSRDFVIKAAGVRPGGSAIDERPTTPTGSRPSVQATAALVTASRPFILSPTARSVSFHGVSTPTRIKPLGPFDLASPISSTARRFLMRPGPINDTMRCRVYRNRSGLLGSIFQYDMVLEDSGTQTTFLTACRHHRANGAAAFRIFMTDDDDPMQEQVCVGKLHASFMGTDYVLTGAGEGTGMSESKFGHGASLSNDEFPQNSELGAIMYASNIMGTKGPRKAVVVLPKLVPASGSTWELQPSALEGSLTERRVPNNVVHFNEIYAYLLVLLYLPYIIRLLLVKSYTYILVQAKGRRRWRMHHVTQQTTALESHLGGLLPKLWGQGDPGVCEEYAAGAGR